jgi:glycine/D-amino acid oxidase-like deaminating enzyme
MKVDYLVAGCGLSGVLLSWSLIKAGRSVIVFDDRQMHTASRVAGGIINPVTGKRMVRTWLIEELLPFARQTYGELGDELNTPLVKECCTLDFYADREQKNLFEERMKNESHFLRQVENVINLEQCRTDNTLPGGGHKGFNKWLG